MLERRALQRGVLQLQPQGGGGALGRAGLRRRGSVRVRSGGLLLEVGPMNVPGLRVVVGGRAGEVAGPGSPAPAGLLAELYEKHAAAVYGRCRYLLKDDAEAKDALQDVFVKALRAVQAGRKVETESPDRRELVRVVLGLVPEEAQEVAVLYFVDELTQAEIA